MCVSDGGCVPMSAGVGRGQRLEVPGAELQRVGNCLMACWELNSGPLQKQYAFLAPETAVSLSSSPLFMRQPLTESETQVSTPLAGT